MKPEDIESREELKSAWIEANERPVWDAAMAEDIRKALVPVAKRLNLEDWTRYLEAREAYGIDYVESVRRLSDFLDWARKNRECVDDWIFAEGLRNYGIMLHETGDNVAALETIPELLDCFCGADSLDLWISHAKSLASAVLYAGQEGGEQGLLPYLEELRSLVNRHDEAGVRVELARSLVNAGIYAGNDGGVQTSEPYLKELRELASKYDDAFIRKGLATALFNASNDAAKDGGVQARQPYLEELRGLARKHDEVTIRECLAKALFNAGDDAPKDGGVQARQPYLEELRELARKHDEASVRASLAKALVNAGVDAGDQDGLQGVLPYLVELRDLARKHDEATVRAELAKTLANAGVDASNQDGLQGALPYLVELRDLASEYDEAAIRVELAKALFNVGNTAAKYGGLQARQPYLDELRMLVEKHGEASIREMLAKSLYNSAVDLQENGEIKSAHEACKEASYMLSCMGHASALHERVAIFENRLRIALEQAGEEVLASGVAAAPSGTQAGVVAVQGGLKEEREGAPPLASDAGKAEQAKEKPQFAGGGEAREIRTRLRMALDTVISELRPVKPRFLEQMANGRERAERFLDSKGRFPSDTSVLLVLRQWNSYTPILVDGQESDRGGGYFLRHKELGLVIDPGYNFIEQFHIAGCKVVDITHIAITHAHDDHTAQLEQILTLFHQYNTQERNEPKKVTLLLNHSTLKKFSGFSLYRDCAYVEKVICLNAYDGENEQIIRLTGKDGAPLGVSLTVLPARHDDVFSSRYAVGLGLRIDTENGERRIVFTGDTGLYPPKLDQDGKVVKGCYLDSKKNKVEERLVDEGAKSVCEEYPAPFKKGVNLLVPHLGSIKEYEFDPVLPTPVGNSEQKEIAASNLEPMFYPNHLGILGTAMLIMETEPEAVVLSEFGAELRGLRMEITTLLRKAIKNARNGSTDKVTKNDNGGEPFIIPGDPSIVYHIPDGCFLCHEDNSFQPPQALEAKEVGQDRIGLFKKGGSYASLERFDRIRELLVKSGVKDERLYPLPYMPLPE